MHFQQFDFLNAKRIHTNVFGHMDSTQLTKFNFDFHNSEHINYFFLTIEVVFASLRIKFNEMRVQWRVQGLIKNVLMCTTISKK